LTYQQAYAIITPVRNQNKNMSQVEILEPTPIHYQNSVVTRELGDENKELALLENLRRELVFGAPTDERVNSTYSVVRNIGDVELYAADVEVGGLLDATRMGSLPSWFQAELSDTKGNIVGRHSEAEKVLGIDFNHLNDVSKNLVATLEAKGTPLKQASDAYLAVYMHVTGHETGHAILSGISRFEHTISVAPKQANIATRTFLGKRPEKGFTGNWETDVQIREEQFAEGYAQMVVLKTLKLLGYEEEQALAIIELSAPGYSWEVTAEGQHQIDHIEKVGAEAPIDKVMAAAVDDDEALVNSHQNYRGELGYSAPLTKEEIVEQLVETSKLLKVGEFDQINPDVHDWEAKVKVGQSEEVRKHIEMLRDKRAELFAPKSEKEKRILGRIRRIGGQASKTALVKQR
jgi:hypothetical protein